MAQQSFIDASKPNEGRIYDYLLGGSHNFNIDRITGDRIRQLAPFLPKAMRLQRWCLQDLAVELTRTQNFDVIVDFASGLPTSDHIHHTVKPGTIVIYSDYDPVVVEYAHEILAGAENTYYFLADAGKPEELLNRPEVKALIGPSRLVAFIFWGVSAFLKDEEIRHSLQFLFERSGTNTRLCFNAQGPIPNYNRPSMTKLLSIYKQMNASLHPRTLDDYKNLINPWLLDKNGFISLSKWHGMESELSSNSNELWGANGGGHGAILKKLSGTND